MRSHFPGRFLKHFLKHLSLPGLQSQSPRGLFSYNFTLCNGGVLEASRWEDNGDERQ